MVTDAKLLIDPMSNVTESAKQFCQDIFKIKHKAACRSYSSYNVDQALYTQNMT